MITDIDRHRIKEDDRPNVSSDRSTNATTSDYPTSDQITKFKYFFYSIEKKHKIWQKSTNYIFAEHFSFLSLFKINWKLLQNRRKNFFFIVSIVNKSLKINKNIFKWIESRHEKFSNFDYIQSADFANISFSIHWIVTEQTTSWNFNKSKTKTNDLSASENRLKYKWWFNSSSKRLSHLWERHKIYAFLSHFVSERRVPRLIRKSKCPNSLKKSHRKYIWLDIWLFHFEL